MFKEKKVLHVLSEEYVNPFDSSLDTDCLYKLSSGVTIDTELADQILMTERSGEESSSIIDWTAMKSFSPWTECSDTR